MENLINILIVPSNLMTWLFIAALPLYFIKRIRLSLACVLGAISIYFIFGCGPVSQFLLRGLEYQYPQYSTSHSSIQPVSAIVLLSGSADPKPLTPVSSHPNVSSAYRLLETRRIFQLHPQATVIVSGLGITPETLKEGLISLGVPASGIEVDNQSYHTFDSAKNLSSRLNDQAFILVTSAGHMPRAMAVFKAQGMEPIPAPTEFKSWQNILAAQYSPTPRHMVYSDLAVHEYLGILWYKLTNRI